jgi:hypothetical protein
MSEQQGECHKKAYAVVYLTPLLFESYEYKNDCSFFKHFF